MTPRIKGRLPPFIHKTVFTRAEPPMSQTEVGFPKFEPVCEKSETKVQFDAIFLAQENGSSTFIDNFETLIFLSFGKNMSKL